MADTEISEAGDSAEKAYAAAAEAVEPKPVAEPAPVEFPSKAKRVPKPGVPASTVVSSPKPAPLEVAAPKAAALPVKAAPSKPAAPVITKPKTALIENPADSQLKETPMATQTTDFTGSAGTASNTFGGLKDVFTDVKTKAKAAFDKGTSSIGDVTEFAKGNVEAVVESGKIYAAGLQELGSTYVAEGKTAFEALTADAKELAAQKTPVDFFKLQSELAKKNFESAMAFGTKSRRRFRADLGPRQPGGREGQGGRLIFRK
jgi:hypothetical protein